MAAQCAESSQPARVSIDVPSVYQKAKQVKSVYASWLNPLRKLLETFPDE